MIYEFGQAESATATSGFLKSDRHHNCHCIIAINGNGAAHMMHVWEGANNGLDSEQKEDAEAFAVTSQEIQAIVITGSKSWLCGENDDDKGLAQEYLEQELGIEFPYPPIDVKSGDKEWGVLYNVETREILITDENGGMLYNGTLFENAMPTYTPASRFPESLPLEI